MICQIRDLRGALVAKIRRETANHLDGKPSYIRWKLNSLLDEKMIEELYLAAKAGVKIDIVTRGICAFRLSHVAQHQNVRIRSILGRFLEHSRIFHFHNDGNPEYFIGSADIMDRNLNRRIEALVQIKRETHIRSLNQILEESFNNQFTHWQMDEDDKWCLHKENKSNSDYQEFFIETITEGARND